MTDMDRVIASHCGPVLLRRKPASLFTVARADMHARAFWSAISQHGLSFQVLCDRGEGGCGRMLVLVYNRAMLAARLSGETEREALAALGYPMDGPLLDQLRHLRTRVQATDDGFPHEIGFFLGYPTADVLGFMQHRGKHCKHCGLWKVYGDVKSATALFAEYDACRAMVLRHVEQGGSLSDLPTGWQNDTAAQTNIKGGNTHLWTKQPSYTGAEQATPRPWPTPSPKACNPPAQRST